MPAVVATLGFSKEATFMGNVARKEQRRIADTNALSNEPWFDEPPWISPLFEDLATVGEECRYPNWDGYGALAVDQDTLRNAYMLLESLPLDCPYPSIGAEPDGDLTLEWYHSRKRTLSISVTPFGELHYAALLGPNSTSGTEIFSGDIPERLLELISQVMEP